MPISSGERIQKALARLGLGSRRELELAIEAGDVLVNGQVATLGGRVQLEDEVSFRGKIIRLKPENECPQVLLYHKPVGQICTKKDPENRDSVFNYLPRCASGRWVMVGRLDLNTAGLLLFTDDGALANQLMHPKFAVEREYAVRVYGDLTLEKKKALLAGVVLEDGPGRFEKITDQGGEGRNHWYHVVIKEGRNREVRRLFDAVELTVSRLIRIRYGNIVLPEGLKQSQYEYLPETAVRDLLKQFSLEKKIPKAQAVNPPARQKVAIQGKRKR
ncbi:MAG: pseudouridine synthase [Gammaproteobacteria bacterium]|nr:pseudouridine synthase [Gammaproteobacteria bacterium]